MSIVFNQRINAFHTHQISWYFVIVNERGGTMQTGPDYETPEMALSAARRWCEFNGVKL